MKVDCHAYRQFKNLLENSESWNIVKLIWQIILMSKLVGDLIQFIDYIYIIQKLRNSMFGNKVERQDGIV